MADSELALSETKIRELSGFLSSAKEEQAEMARHHSVELKRGREVRGKGGSLCHALVIGELYMVQQHSKLTLNKLNSFQET